MAMATKSVHIRRDGLLMRIFPLDERLGNVLRQRLTYKRSKYLATAVERRKAGNRHMLFYKVRCYKILTLADKTKQLVTNSGYFRRIAVLLHKLGYSFDVKDLRPLGRAGAFVVRKETIDATNFRPRQKEILLKMLTTNRAQIHYPTGAGKSFLARVVCGALPKARIVFTTRHQAVLKEVYASLKQNLPNVGIYCSDMKANIGARVMCCSAGSLHKAVDWKPDLIIGDETHELATANLLEKLSYFKYCRFIGLSANYRDRMDGVDFELEGLFGPVIATLSYEDAVKVGLVVPIHVHWRHVYCQDMLGPKPSRIDKQRFGFWRNAARNKLIAQDARRFPNEQVLIVVKTIEHAVYLGKLLPEYTLCYAPGSADARIQKWIERGLLPPTYRPLTKKGLDDLKKQFEAGTLRRVIATSVWNRGVNFHNLSVLIRAGGGASKLDDTQIPGRLSRLGKSYGLLLDYFDDFNDQTNSEAWSRYRQYRRRKWQQRDPEAESDEKSTSRKLNLKPKPLPKPKSRRK